MLISQKSERITEGHGSLDQDEQVTHLLTANIWTHTKTLADDSLH